MAISPKERVSLYAQARNLPTEFAKKAKLQLPFVMHQDPVAAGRGQPEDLDLITYAAWEPGIADGPTSARFAVVDYNADTGILEPPAVWAEKQQCFVGIDGVNLDRLAACSAQFHQVNVWARLQRALSFFENGKALGRSISWAFDGNRLIVVPHAGYGKNAYYDRASKSLQFYSFDASGKTIDTCLSADIVSHEFGHAVLDGVRPLFSESISLQTAAFHEFIGDLTVLLMRADSRVLLNSRKKNPSGGVREIVNAFAAIGVQFGRAAFNKPYLRSGRNKRGMGDLQHHLSPHDASEVLTGAMFDVLIKLAKRNGDDQHPSSAMFSNTPSETVRGLQRVADGLQHWAIQPLDLLPPVEVTFRDYAMAVCRSQQIENPMEAQEDLNVLTEIFRKRRILSRVDAQRFTEPGFLSRRVQFSVHHNVNDFSRSRAAAYRFLDDNREDLLIPSNRDFVIADLYDANKISRQGQLLPRHIILQYVWREEVALDGSRFGRFDGSSTAMLCGGTLVFDDNGNLLSWAMKPGSLPYGGKRNRVGRISLMWEEAVLEGLSRKQALLENLATHIAAGRIGKFLGSSKGLLGSHVPPLVFEEKGGLVKFQIAPHFHLSGQGDYDIEVDEGDRQWEISC